MMPGQPRPEFSLAMRGRQKSAMYRRVASLAFLGVAIHLGLTKSAAREPRAAKSTAGATGSEIVPTGMMGERRSDHSATLLRDGKVLIAGGMVRNGEYLAEAELYDPASGKFTAAGQMVSARVGHTATVLPDGRVLVAGGSSRPDENAGQAEVYDPGTGRFEATGSMMTPRSAAQAALLRDGKVLIAGGNAGADWNRLASAELYDPRTGKFEATGSMSVARISFAMCTLKDGRVLVTGGSMGGRYPNTQITASAEIYDPATGKFSPTGSMATARHKHALALLEDGRVLVAGGSDNRDWRGKMNSAEIYDPASGKFSDAGKMSETRFKLTNAMVRLPDGKVLIGGGAGHAEIFDPSSMRFELVPGPEMDGRYFSTATLLRGGRVLLAGGYGDNVEPSSKGAWIYVPSGKSTRERRGGE